METEIRAHLKLHQSEMQDTRRLANQAIDRSSSNSSRMDGVSNSNRIIQEDYNSLKETLKTRQDDQQDRHNRDVIDRLAAMDRKFDQRFTHMKQVIKSVEDRLQRLNDMITTLDATDSSHSTQLQDQHQRLTSLELEWEQWATEGDDTVPPSSLMPSATADADAMIPEPSSPSLPPGDPL